MPIKLADVIENVNSNFGIVETSKHNIVGLYNGAVGTSPSLEIFYADGVKMALTSDGDSANRVEVYKLPFAQSSAANFVAAADSLKLETRKGGLISVYDDTLAGGSGGQALYIAQQDPTAGNVSDTTRSTMQRWTELVQDFDMYSDITGDAAFNGSGDFFLAGYDTTDKKTKRLNIDSLFSALSAELATSLVNDGIITTTQAGGSGLVGDVNGDGQMTAQDLIILLGSFNTSGGFESNVVVLDNAAETVGPISPVFVNTTTSFTISNLTTFQLPTNLTQTGAAFGFASISRAANQANFIKLNDSTIVQTSANSHWQNRSVEVEVTVNATFTGPDALHAIAHLELTSKDASETTQEIMAYMSYMGIGVPAEGAFTTGFYGSGNDGLGINIAQTMTFSVSFAPVAPAGNTNGGGYAGNPTFTPLTFFDDHSSALENGFNLAHQINSEYIEDVRASIFFTSQSENVSVIVTSMRLIITPHQ